MKKKKKTSLPAVVAIFVYLAILVIAAVTTSPETVVNSGWALFPPVVAIALSLITKEVYSSLFLGVLTGAILYAGADFDGILSPQAGQVEMDIRTGVRIHHVTKPGSRIYFGMFLSEFLGSLVDNGSCHFVLDFSHIFIIFTYIFRFIFSIRKHLERAITDCRL